ncbi:MAG: 16S rRNA (adenine(1518)-N(6)/adenine(1519)-N(6))-dimethyltransferase RsmA [Flavitalea sp.]
MDYSLKKSLGQHFLVDESVSKRIVDVLLEQKPTQLLEVGPGGGALTKYLVNIDGIDFRCVELDDEKVAWLEKNFPVLKGRIIHESILDINPPFEGNFTLIGNFPYNISSQIVFKVIEWKEQVNIMIGMFQKEVAERLAAKHGSKVYGVTSVLTQAFFEVDYLFEVGEQAFNPPPKVKSAVIRMSPRKQPLEIKSERALFNLVKTAFNQRRKTLRNALKPIFLIEDMQEELFNKRAEQLSVEDFAALTFRMK